jgi:uncharacterized protein YqkB
MKQLLSLFLFLLPCLAWAQYPSNGNQKITLGEQTTADGIIWRGVSSDTTLTTKSDTAAYFVLDTVNKKLYFYKASAIPKWNEISGSGGGGAGTVTSITGGTGLTGGTITTSGTLAADTNFLVTRFDTASMLTNYYRSGRTGIIQASDVPTLNQNTTGSAATLTTSRTFQTNLASTSTASFNGSANVTPGVTGTLPVANGGTNASTFTSGSVVFAGSSGTYTQDNSNLFFDNGNNRLGVATNTPTQKLHVVGNAYITSKIAVGLDPSGIGGAVLGLQTTNNNTEYFRGYNATGSTRFGWDLVSDEAVLTLFGNNDVKMRTNGDSYLNGGKVGIGTASPLALLNVMGTVRINSASAPDANYYLQLENSSSQKAKANAWDTYSDSRIKTNRQPIINAIDKINLLNPTYYNQHDSYVEDDLLNIDYNNSYKSLGFIAQEVYEVIPEAVNMGTTNELWAMDYTKLIPILTKAIQEQQAQIEALKQRLLILENK